MVTADPRARLLQLSQERGVSLAQLSAMIGRNTTYLQQFVRKGSPRRLEERDRVQLAQFFGVPQAQLGAPEEIYRIEGKFLRGDWVEVPRLPLGASAGPGSFAGGEEPVGAFGFQASWLRQQGLDPAMLSAIVVEGDSMEPLLRDGDEIVVDRTSRPHQDGIHVVRADDALLVKRVAFGRPGIVRLTSENPAYEPFELPLADVEIVGRVVWKGGRL